MRARWRPIVGSRFTPLLCASAAAALLAASVEPSSCKSLESRNHLISRLTNELPAKRTTLILSERQIEQLVALLNAILDLDDFTDAEEQVIFRHAVSSVVQAVQNKLPRPFLQLLEHKGEGEGLGEEQAATLATRLQHVVHADVDLPYLNAKHERQLTAAVVEMLVLAMRRGSSFEAALRIERAGPVVMQVRVCPRATPTAIHTPRGPASTGGLIRFEHHGTPTGVRQGQRGRLLLRAREDRRCARRRSRRAAAAAQVRSLTTAP